MSTRYESHATASRSRKPTADDTARTEGVALRWLAACTVLVITWLAWPFVISILLGALMAFTVAPVYEGLVRRSGRPLFAGVTTVIASSVAVISVLPASSHCL
jgi:predicted PurR-regulated permease PerM